MEEKILIQGLCNRIKGAIVENGHGMLTNQRFIYSKHGFAKIALMGVFVNLTKGDFDFDIAIDNIKNIQETKRLLSKILLINTKDGEEYKFYFTKLEEWKLHFNNVLSADINHENITTCKTDGIEKSFCSKCGNRLDSKDIFCPKCGNKI